jgi:ubiquitin-like 1-activating enzyme E1 B
MNGQTLAEHAIGKRPDESSVLVVGAGGIGCELLKCLALSRFRSIGVIDLDTIEVSNLNRQFLFRREHVGQAKATVACDSIRRLCPSIEIEPFHGDVITDARFDMSFYKKYDLVINALDNVQARQHVNRMCLLCSKPLIDSGSTGYNGQATLIVKGRTQCYDCIEKPKQQRTYAVCTIRNTPSQPIHCIVWAKFLYNQLFGDNDDPNNEDVTPDADDPENDHLNSEDDERARVPTTTNGHHRVSTRDWIHTEMNAFDPKRVFNKLFFDDINYLTTMRNLWEKRRQPTPIDYEKASQIMVNHQHGQDDHERTTMPKLNDQRIERVADYVQMFIESLNELKQRADKQRHIGRRNDDARHRVHCVCSICLASTSKEPMFLVWDKNDDADLRFVTASANLRAFIFGIDLTSKFDVKSMAGNIIPAVATTNAIVAGITVLQARKILGTLSRVTNESVLTSVKSLTNVFISTDRKSGAVIQSIALEEPNPSCIQCSDLDVPVRVRMNMSLFTLRSLYERLIRTHLKMTRPDVIIADGSGRILISADDDDDDEHMMLKTLDQFKLINGTILLCEEECDDLTDAALIQQMKLKLMLEHTDTIQDGDEYVIADEHEHVCVKPVKRSLKRKLSETNDDNDDEPIEHVNGQDNPSTMVKKTKRLSTISDEQTHVNGADQTVTQSNGHDRDIDEHLVDRTAKKHVQYHEGRPADESHPTTTDVRAYRNDSIVQEFVFDLLNDEH